MADAPGHAAALEGLACVAAARGDATEAARLLGAAAWWRESRHRPASRLEAADRVRAESVALEHLGESAFQIAYSDGLALQQSGVEEPEATAAPA